jgi:hypothetical protein
LTNRSDGISNRDGRQSRTATVSIIS